MFNIKEFFYALIEELGRTYMVCYVNLKESDSS